MSLDYAYWFVENNRIIRCGVEHEKTYFRNSATSYTNLTYYLLVITIIITIRDQRVLTINTV